MIHQKRQTNEAMPPDGPEGADGPAALLIDSERHLLDVSAGGAALLDEASVLTRSFGRLVATCQCDMMRIEQAINTARWGSTGSTGLDCGRLAINVVRMGADRRHPNYLLLARAAIQSAGRLAEGAAKRFGFTAAEGRLLVHLLDGLALREAATQLGVANTTARTHLQRIFDKTGVRRQTDLQRMIAAEAHGGTLWDGPSS